MASSSMRAVVSKLPTRDDVEALRRGRPIAKGPTRLNVKTASDRDEVRDERRWRKAVIKRDGRSCRCCDRAVVAQLELAANRLEVHHVAGRADQAVRWDVRNGLVLCAECHGKVTGRLLFITQAARALFRIGQTTYINAAKKVSFQPKAAA